jgi:hypothetical protein
MRKLASLLIACAAYSSVARADVTCVSAPAPSGSECVIHDDGAFLSNDAFDRVTSAAARSKELERQVSALALANDARIREVTALRADVSERKRASELADKMLADSAALVAAKDAELTADRSSLLHNPLLMVGIGAAIGAAVTCLVLSTAR